MKKGQAEIIIPLITVLFFAVVIFLLWGFSIVNYNEYTVEREFGQLDNTIKDAGIRWIGFGTLIRINNQIRNYEISIDGASSDFQDVQATLNLNIKINKDQVYNFVNNYKTEDLFNQYLNNKVQEKVKQIMLNYNAEDVLTKRDILRKEMYQAVIEIEELKYFTFNDLTIKNIEFSEEFNERLERRAGVNQEKVIIQKQKENLELIQKNMESINIDEYFKYQLIEKWDGKANLIISDAILTTN